MPQTLDLFRLAFEMSPSGIIVIDSRGTIVLANREVERLFGYTRDQLVGRSVEMLVPARFRTRHPGFREGFFHNPQALPMGAGRDLFGLRKDGRRYSRRNRVNPITAERGSFVLGSVVDISARRLLEERLRQAQKMEAIGTLAGGVAHDFNNLLRAIVGYSELVATKLTSTQALANLDQVRRAAERGHNWCSAFSPSAGTAS